MTSVSAQREPDQPITLAAAIDLLDQTGARYVDFRTDLSTEPHVWAARAKWGNRWSFGAGDTPVSAILKIAEEGIDGWECASCGRPSGLDPEGAHPSPLTGFDTYCWIAYDETIDLFVRSCGGHL
jgi:hypothetical protein